jgi:response regulator of citrate/malate metabolism
VAGDVGSGRRLFAIEEPEVIPVDFSLPDGSGLELIRCARDRMTTSDVMSDRLRWWTA